jgi:hypothetical protein
MYHQWLLHIRQPWEMLSERFGTEHNALREKDENLPA